MEWITGIGIFLGGSFFGVVATFIGMKWLASKKMEDLTDQFTKKCPECGEDVASVLDECPECGHEFEEGNDMFDFEEEDD